MTSLLVLLVAALVTATPAAADPPATPTISELASQAEAVVLGRVERTTRHDVVGVRLHRVRALRVLSGRLRDPDPDILEFRDGPAAAPMLEVGRRVIVFLLDGPPLSDFGDDLPRIPCFVTVAGSRGVIAVNSDADVEAVEAALRNGARVSFR